MAYIKKEDEINFNYPIPRTLHHEIKVLSAKTGVKIKDIIIQALMLWVTRTNKIMKMMNDEEMDDMMFDEEL